MAAGACIVSTSREGHSEGPHRDRGDDLPSGLPGRGMCSSARTQLSHRVPRSRSSSPSSSSKIAKILSEQCGRPLAPKLLGSTDVSAGPAQAWGRIYSRYCVQCHGVNGDGNGVAAVVPDSQAAELPPGDLQVHLHDLRLQAAPRGPDPDGAARHPGHVDARVPPAAAQGPRGGRRLRAGPDPPRRAGDEAGRAGRVRRADRRGAGSRDGRRRSSTGGTRPAARSSIRRRRCPSSSKPTSTRARRRS